MTFLAKRQHYNGESLHYTYCMSSRLCTRVFYVMIAVGPELLNLVLPPGYFCVYVVFVTLINQISYSSVMAGAHNTSLVKVLVRYFFSVREPFCDRRHYEKEREEK